MLKPVIISPFDFETFKDNKNSLKGPSLHNHQIYYSETLHIHTLTHIHTDPHTHLHFENTLCLKVISEGCFDLLPLATTIV